jgi:TPR repeat protein
MGGLAEVFIAAGRRAEALGWLRKAARAGNSAAMNNLAVVLKERGELARAGQWYRRAIEAGNGEAEQNLRLLWEQRAYLISRGLRLAKAFALKGELAGTDGLQTARLSR